MITIDSSPTQRFRHSPVKSLPITGGRVFWNRQSWNELRLFVRESRLARVVLAIIVALVVLAVLRMLGVFESVAGWSVLRSVSGWVGPAAAAGAAGAAAAAAAAGAGGPRSGASGGSSGVPGSGDPIQGGNNAPPQFHEPSDGYTTFSDDGNYTVHFPNGKGGFHTVTYDPRPPEVEHWWDLRGPKDDRPTRVGSIHSENESAVEPERYFRH